MGAHRQTLAKLVSQRTAWFAPPYDQMYKVLEGNEHVKVADLRKSTCLDAARAAGVPIGAPPADQLQVLTPGGPEVVRCVHRPDGKWEAVS